MRYLGWLEQSGWVEKFPKTNKRGGWNFKRIYFKEQTDIFNNKRT